MTLAEIADVLDSFNLRGTGTMLRQSLAKGSDVAQIVAVSTAIGAVRGYAAALKNHTRALHNTSAEHEREHLAFLAGELRGHVEELTKKVAA